MLLGTRNLTSGDTRLIRISYAGFLTPGAKLASATVSVSTANVLSTVLSPPFLDIDNDAVFFYVVGGANVNETFTVAVQVKDNQQQIVNDTIMFLTVSP